MIHPRTRTSEGANVREESGVDCLRAERSLWSAPPSTLDPRPSTLDPMTLL